MVTAAASRAREALGLHDQVSGNCTSPSEPWDPYSLDQHQRTRAVSYTHLDVYKRQPEPGQYDERGLVKQAGELTAMFLAMTYEEAVSYTHLCNRIGKREEEGDDAI